VPDHPTLAQLSSVFTRADSTRHGVSKRRLYAWRDAGLIEPLGRGLFMKAGTEGDPDLIEIAVRAPGATLCLTSALARHDLTDQIPGTVHVAIERRRRPPRTAAPVTWHRFAEATFAIDREEFEVTAGHWLGVYGPTRSVIDTFRLRHIQGQDTAVEALRRWLKSRDNQPSKLLEMLHSFPTAVKATRAALEILL
jgi:predicted transcriptional regulator of viral defense system